MISWESAGSKMLAFTYYPLLEIAVGVFLLIMSFVVPVLFLAYNGIKAEQWGELLFCAGFFALFFFMGRSLTFQSLAVRKTASGFSFYQNMREPAVKIELQSSDWLGIKTSESGEKDEIFTSILLKTSQGDKDFYKSVNRKEINSIIKALEDLRTKSEEESP